jgi:hypothetical protein
MQEMKMVATMYPHIVKENGQAARLEKHPRIRVAMIVMDYLAYGWSQYVISGIHQDFTLV